MTCFDDDPTPIHYRTELGGDFKAEGRGLVFFITLVPIYLAQRLTSETADTEGKE